MKKINMEGILSGLALDMMYGTDKKLVVIFSPTQSLKFTRRHKADRRENHGEAIFTWGRLNYREKQIANKLKAKDFPYFIVTEQKKKVA